MKPNTKSDCNITSWKALEKFFDQLTKGLEKSCQFKHVMMYGETTFDSIEQFVVKTNLGYIFGESREEK
jgi:hypothetical protein